VLVRALGIDYGERRIGLALSDPTGLLASPWKTLANHANLDTAATRIAAELTALRDASDDVDVIVIGLPRRLNGEPTEQTRRVRSLSSLLSARTALPVVLQDERLTSHAADALLSQRERDWRKRKDHIDQMAAALILQDYLDHQRSR
jgi:putative holliday junction resolvase